MANDDTAAARGGLWPATQPFGTVKRGYYRLTTNTIAVYLGQPMDLDANGQAVAAAARSNNTATAAGNCIIGPVIGFARDAQGKQALPDSQLVLTASAGLGGNINAYVCIADDPNQEFIIQECSTGTQLDTSAVGTVVGFVYDLARTTSGSGLTGVSFAEVDPVTANANAGSGVLNFRAPLKVLGLADNMNSDGSQNTLGAYAKWRVRIANHRATTPL